MVLPLPFGKHAKKSKSLYDILFKQYLGFTIALFGFGIAVFLYKRVDNRVYVGGDPDYISNNTFRNYDVKTKKHKCYRFERYLVDCPSTGA